MQQLAHLGVHLGYHWAGRHSNKVYYIEGELPNYPPMPEQVAQLQADAAAALAEETQRTRFTPEVQGQPQPQVPMMQLQVPAGAQPGQQLSVVAPSGAQVAVVVPTGVVPGQMIQVPVPVSTTAPATPSAPPKSVLRVI